MEPTKKKIKVLRAEYVKDCESIVILGECGEGQMRTQINKSSFSFGARTEAEIDYEMEKTASLMVGKEINLVFDAELEQKIDCGQRLNY
jgi:hypothetical protein